MAQKPEWAARRNVGGAWFAHKEGERTNAELRFSKKCYEGKDEFQRWDYLKNPNDLTPWQVERGGSKWTKKGVMPQRRKKEQIRPEEQRLRNEVRKQKLKERTEAVRRVELAKQEIGRAHV